MFQFPIKKNLILGMVRKSIKAFQSMDGAMVKQSNQSSEYVETI